MDTTGWAEQGWVEQRPGVWRQDTQAGEEAEYRFFCQDCGCTREDYQDFMVHDELWRRVMRPADRSGMGGMICRPCFERRLERPLTVDDLTDYPSNRELRRELGYETPLVLRQLDESAQTYGEVARAFVLASTGGRINALEQARVVEAARLSLVHGRLRERDFKIWLREILVDFEPGFALRRQEAVAAFFVAAHLAGVDWVDYYLDQFSRLDTAESRQVSRVAARLKVDRTLELEGME